MRAKKLLTSRQIFRYAVPARTVTKKALYFSIGNGERREPALWQLYRHTFVPCQGSKCPVWPVTVKHGRRRLTSAHKTDGGQHGPAASRGDMRPQPVPTACGRRVHRLWCGENTFCTPAWASAHRGKWGQLTPGKMDEKLKSENMQKRAVFYVYVILWEQSEQADVENGAMLTAYLFRYTSECTIS